MGIVKTSKNKIDLGNYLKSKNVKRKNKNLSKK